MTDFMKVMRKKASSRLRKICFADYTDNKLYEAIKVILKENIITPVVVGEEKVILKRLREFKIPKSRVVIFDTNNILAEKFAKQYIKIRSRKEKLSFKDALFIVKKENYFAVMLLFNNLVDGVVTGLSSQTKPFLPAFKIIGTKRGSNRVSSVFIMDFKDKTLFFSDCAVNINPSSKELSEIAVLTAESVLNFEIKPRIAMLSFSTCGSAKHEMVNKVREATKLARSRILKSPRLKSKVLIDGEVQFDAAFVPDVYKKKCPSSSLKGRANTFIFPDLNAGNIGYKLTERLGHAKAIGPLLQGLKKPVNDISRGASYKDLVDIAVLTSVQASMRK